MNPKTSKIRAPREREKKEGVEKGEWGSKDRLGSGRDGTSPDNSICEGGIEEMNSISRASMSDDWNFMFPNVSCCPAWRTLVCSEFSSLLFLFDWVSFWGPSYRHSLISWIISEEDDVYKPREWRSLVGIEQHPTATSYMDERLLST